MKLSRISLVKRLSFFQVLTVLAVMGTFTVVLSSLITRRIEARTESNLKEQVALLVTMMSTYHSALAHNAEVLNSVFRAGYPGEFVVDTAGSAKGGDRQVPLLRAGSKTINGDTESVDAFRRTTRAECSIFVRTGDEFVRVTTSVVDEKGNRVTGSLLDHANPAYQALIRGESFTGKAALYGRDYMTSYTPIRDAQGKTVAVAAVMIDFTAGLKAFADRIVKVKIGKTGYFYAMDARPGAEQGTLRIHPTLTGKNIIGSKDAHGVEFFRDMLERKQGVIRYWWINQALGETRAREKIVAFDYLKEWDWVIAAGSYRDELNTEGVFLRNAMLMAIGLVTLVLVSMFTVMLRRWVTEPLRRAVEETGKLADGDFREMGGLGIDEAATGNEVELLERGIHRMAHTLCGLLEQVYLAVSQLSAASLGIMTSASQSSDTSQSQLSSTTQVATAMLEMVATVEEVGRNSQQAAEAARMAADTARGGGVVVSETLAAMHTIADSTKEVSARIGELGKSSDKIGAVASVISEIAGQTNLLALNAAIEAARAGEQGRGFAVVAGEVRRLAERTTAATSEIAQMIGNVQAAARQAVDAMRRENEGVELGLTRTESSGQALERIIEMAGKVGEMVAHIASAASQQSNAAEEVNGNISRIAEMTAESSHHAGETERACQDLSTLAASLESVIGRFKFHRGVAR